MRLRPPTKYKCDSRNVKVAIAIDLRIVGGISVCGRVYDALGGAGMYAINSYLDLGAGVLILWYGGRLAMHGEGGLTPGKLITFQLYWWVIGLLSSIHVIVRI